MDLEQKLTYEVRGTGRRTKVGTEPGIITWGTSKQLLQCFNHNMSLWRSHPTIPPPDFVVQFREASISSFRKRGYDFRRLGIAKRIRGSRIKIRFDQIGAGVRILAPVEVPLTVLGPLKPPATEQRTTRNESPCIKLISTDPKGDALAEATFIKATVDGGLVELVGTGGTIYATYEVVNTHPNVLNGARIGFHVGFISNTAHDLPGLGTTTMTVYFTPSPGVKTIESLPRNVLSIHPPQSCLLFPYVTSRDGFDTRITIANTSGDPFGTTPQRGFVSLFFFDNSAPVGTTPAYTRYQTGLVQPGKVVVFDLSKGGHGVPPIPDFEGYLIVIANFLYAHATAFITEANENGYSYPAIDIGGRGGGLYREPPVEAGASTGPNRP